MVSFLSLLSSYILCFLGFLFLFLGFFFELHGELKFFKIFLKCFVKDCSHISPDNRLILCPLNFFILNFLNSRIFSVKLYIYVLNQNYNKRKMQKTSFFLLSIFQYPLLILFSIFYLRALSCDATNEFKSWWLWVL